jgi:hypothetical protein
MLFYEFLKIENTVQEFPVACDKMVLNPAVSVIVGIVASGAQRIAQKDILYIFLVERQLERFSDKLRVQLTVWVGPDIGKQGYAMPFQKRNETVYIVIRMAYREDSSRHERTSSVVSAAISL